MRQRAQQLEPAPEPELDRDNTGGGSSNGSGSGSDGGTQPAPQRELAGNAEGMPGDAPRVALMFLSRGPMPLERVWREFFATAAEACASCVSFVALFLFSARNRFGVCLLFSIGCAVFSPEDAGCECKLADMHS